MTLVERFESRVERIPGVTCWLWTAATHEFGYGTFWVGKKCTVAHRFSYSLYVGEIPEGMFVLHKCDVPACVNPDHLFLGTQAANMADKVAKGRARGSHMHGEINPQAKLTAEQVAEIRSNPMTYKEITERFGIKSSQIKRIKRGDTWRTA